MDSSTILYLAFVAAAAAAALAERAHARRNETRLLREGASEIAPWVFRLMVPVYSAGFVAAAAERLLAGRRPAPAWVIAMLLVFLASKALKIWAIRHLAGCWTMKVVLPRSPRIVSTGPYRHLRHPNYVAVIGEILSLPLLGGAWRTAAACFVLFALILFFRVRTEEAALLRHPGYVSAMAGKRRFIPGSR